MRTFLVSIAGLCWLVCGTACDSKKPMAPAPTVVKTPEAKPTAAKPAGEAKPVEAKPADEAKPVEAKAADEAKPVEAKPVWMLSEGLSTPEGVVHDTVADVYLVSNIEGSPLEKDGKAYIVRVKPDGTLMEPRWIDAATEGVTLNAPKGLALDGDTLYVADIDTIRTFDRATGKPIGNILVEGATFLNDVSRRRPGGVWVTDSGLKAGEKGFEPSGTAAIYSVRADGTLTKAAPKDEIAAKLLGAPNGIVADPGSKNGWLMVGFDGSKNLLAGDGMSPPTIKRTLDGGSFDGLEILDDGSILVSSWATGKLYHVPAEGDAVVLASDMKGPADFAYDAERKRVILPEFMGDTLRAIALQ
ncbi:MAG: sugar lactone lactonase YvrE [Myxococcota bacterium]|jgi:sugar lactone lactonase YvrE